MNDEVDTAEESFPSLMAPESIDCRSWLPLYNEALGINLDFCSVCSRPRADHPAAAFPDDHGNSGPEALLRQ